MKGQAAMEYLMTYAWALLIILVVMGIFVFLIMNLQAPERCDFSTQGLVCNQPMPVIEGNELKFRLINEFNERITVYQMNCTDDMGASPSLDCSGSGITIPPGGAETFSVTCDGADTLSAGETYKGKLFISYQRASDTTLGVCRPADAAIVVKKIS